METGRESARLERAMMSLAALLLALGLAGAAGVPGAPPFGEDSAFWGARAVFLAHGEVGGEHPPVYPAVAAALHLLLGLPTVRAAQASSLFCWVVLPPAVAYLATQIGGRAAGRWAGWLTLGLPTLAAWGTRVEPTTMLALATVGVSIAVAGRWPPLLVGALCGMLVGLKESGGLLGVALLSVAVAQAGEPGGPSRARVALLGGLGFGATAGGLTAIIAVHMPISGVGGRVTMPLEQAWALVSRGESMSAMAAPDVPTWSVPGWLKRAIGAPGVWPVTRAAEFAAVQGFRTLAMAGPWAFAVVPALLAASSARAQPAALADPAERADPAKLGHRLALADPGARSRWIPVALLGSALPLELVVFQSRHLEVPLIGAVLAVGLALGRRAEARAKARATSRAEVFLGRWRADPLAWVALTVALGWTGIRLVHIEIPRAQFAVRCASEQAAALDRAASHIPAGAALCSNEPWLHYRHDEPIRTCQEVPGGWPLVVAPQGRGPKGPPIAGAIQLGRCACIGAIVLLQAQQ